MLAAALVPRTSFAYDEKSSAAINVDSARVGMYGYDPVSYFGRLAPQKSGSTIAARHDGATQYFASTANRDRFNAALAKHLRQFGSFCAIGAALGEKHDSDPSAYKVVNDMPYLNVNRDVQKPWLYDVPGNVATADKAWMLPKDKVRKGL
jgi:hypothetical protein